MKWHPSKLVLQDYFENELSESRSELVRIHLMECQYCSELIADMAVVDSYFANDLEDSGTIDSRELIFSDANELLRKRRSILEEQALRRERFARIISLSFLEDLLTSFGKLLLQPKMQYASIGTIILLVVLFSGPRVDLNGYEDILSEEIVVYTSVEPKEDDLADLYQQGILIANNMNVNENAILMQEE